ncbi:MAG: AAA family ATPase [Leptospiraceae bacterium]|nr:AAA family ATPase [Leptospiraceae bacterium]MCP5495062.1 AAA family ATPase [Leptospiraceae bacterium]
MILEKQLYQEIFLKNLFTLLTTDKNAKLMEKKSLTNSIKELNISPELLTSWSNAWKKSQPKSLELPGDTQEVQDMLIYLFASLLWDEPPLQSALEMLLVEFASVKLDRKKGEVLVANRKIINHEKLFQKRFDLIKEKLHISQSHKTKASESPKKFYVANQVTYEGLDELQRLVLAYKLGLHVAIDGPPGVGKTQSVLELSHILSKPIFTKTCSSRTTESHIISFPILTVREGVSVTAQENGPLVRAMIEGGIFYGDEFNLLKEDVQKRMNSAFDDRASIDRMDGQIIKAQNDFWGAISYNPTNNMVSRDLEESVADRFVHFHYERWDADFKALVASNKAKNGRPGNQLSDLEFDIRLEWRGIGEGYKLLRGKESSDGKVSWFDFFTNAPYKENPIYTYHCYDKSSIFQSNASSLKQDLASLAEGAFSEQELARMISRFTELLFSLSHTGESPLLKKIGLSDLKEKEDLELFSLHESSTRIEVACLKHYQKLLSLGWNRYLAQSYAVRIVIDQICYGQFRNKRLRENTTYSLVTLIAKNMRLFAETSKYNTKILTDSILRQNNG